MVTTAYDEIRFALKKQKYYTSVNKETSLFEFKDLSEGGFVFVERMKSKEGSVSKHERNLNLGELSDLIPVWGNKLLGVLKMYEHEDDKKIREKLERGINALGAALALGVNIGTGEYDSL